MGWGIGIGIGWGGGNTNPPPPVFPVTINVQINANGYDVYWVIVDNSTGNSQSGYAEGSASYTITPGAYLYIVGSISNPDGGCVAEISSAYYGQLAYDEFPGYAAVGYNYITPNVDDQIIMNLNGF
jgi:hypothetical protein